jgi:hypothetical protein
MSNKLRRRLKQRADRLKKAVPCDTKYTVTFNRPHLGVELPPMSFTFMNLPKAGNPFLQSRQVYPNRGALEVSFTETSTSGHIYDIIAGWRAAIASSTEQREGWYPCEDPGGDLLEVNVKDIRPLHDLAQWLGDKTKCTRI